MKEDIISQGLVDNFYQVNSEGITLEDKDCIEGVNGYMKADKGIRCRNDEGFVVNICPWLG